jgi:folate-dependent phosphoribosylglycinamide formyltransferase PurN
MGKLRVVVLTARSPGITLAAALSALPEIHSITIVTTRVVPRQTLLRKLRRMYLHEGGPGVRQALLRRLRGASARNGEELGELVRRACPGARHIHLDDLHAAESLAMLRGLAPDLGVVFATYRLGREVFSLPRLGCLNLHLGRAPEYRGSSPGFYEMLDGVPEVGVTVHRVSEKLDEGPILLQERFPLDLAPATDPLEYLKRYQSEVLIPQGIRLMSLAVQRVAHGIDAERKQGNGPPPRPRAIFRLQQELRERVAERRTELEAEIELAPWRTIDIPTS